MNIRGLPIKSTTASGDNLGDLVYDDAQNAAKRCTDLPQFLAGPPPNLVKT